MSLAPVPFGIATPGGELVLSTFKLYAHGGKRGGGRPLLPHAARRRRAGAGRRLGVPSVTADAHAEEEPSQVRMLRQFSGHLRRPFLLVGADERTCASALAAQVPCFSDGMLNTSAQDAASELVVRKSLRKSRNMFGRHVLLKWFYARALLNLRYHLVFSDPDIAWVQDPFANWERAPGAPAYFDLQGLADIRSVNLTTQKHHEITCIRPWMESMYEHSRRSVYPCQSTGLWYMRDGPASRALLDGLYGYLTARPNEWEQKAFQLLVMRYLVGLGDELPPLRYRLLPTARYINIEFFEERRRLKMETAGTVAVHCGYLKNTADKLEHLETNGFLRRGLGHHRKLYTAVRALGEAGHGSCCAADERLYGHSDTPIELTMRRKNHTLYSIALRRRAR